MERLDNRSSTLLDCYFCIAQMLSVGRLFYLRSRYEADGRYDGLAMYCDSIIYCFIRKVTSLLPTVGIENCNFI